MARTAYCLKEEYKDEFSGGSLALPDGTTYDVHAELEDDAKSSPKDFIVTDDPVVVAALDNYEALKRTSLSEAKAPTKPESKSDSKGGKS